MITSKLIFLLINSWELGRIHHHMVVKQQKSEWGSQDVKLCLQSIDNLSVKESLIGQTCELYQQSYVYIGHLTTYCIHSKKSHRENINKDVTHWTTSCECRYYAEPRETLVVIHLSIIVFHLHFIFFRLLLFMIFHMVSEF